MQMSSLPCWQTAPLLHKQQTMTCVCLQEPVSARMSALFPNLEEVLRHFFGWAPNPETVRAACFLWPICTKQTDDSGFPQRLTKSRQKWEINSVSDHQPDWSSRHRLLKMIQKVEQVWMEPLGSAPREIRDWLQRWSVNKQGMTHNQTCQRVDHMLQQQHRPWRPLLEMIGSVEWGFWFYLCYFLSIQGENISSQAVRAGRRAPLSETWVTEHPDCGLTQTQFNSSPVCLLRINVLSRLDLVSLVLTGSNSSLSPSPELSGHYHAVTKQPYTPLGRLPSLAA